MMSNLSYEQALHGVQTAIAYEITLGSKDTTPKYLRVGVNSALINDAALVRLLVKKGIITVEEYFEEIRLEANRELERYEKKHSGIEFR